MRRQILQDKEFTDVDIYARQLPQPKQDIVAGC
jgi:hypothetical protein